MDNNIDLTEKDKFINEVKKGLNEVRFEIDGYQCLILRIPNLGHLCGYVGINVNKFKDFDEDEYMVHGGITFNKIIEHCSFPMMEYFENCTHVIGFDTAHFMDFTPKYPDFGGTYKDVPFVKGELESLVEQLKKDEVN